MTEKTILALPAEDQAHVLCHVAGWQALRGRRLLLTGGTGFIGKWLLGTFLYANRSLGLDARVVVLSRNVAAFLDQNPALAAAAEIDWLQGDVRNFELGPALRCGLAIHAATDVVASRSPSAIFDDCVAGTRRVIEQLRQSGGQRMLMLSSGAIYGRTPDSLERIPEDYMGAPDCLSTQAAYGEGKRASELLCAMAAAEHGLQIPIARCFAFVGPHLPLDKHFAIGNFIAAAMRDEPLHILGDGTPMRSYLYAADLAVWLWTLLFEGRSSRAYNVGGAESLSIAALAHRVVAALGAHGEVMVAQQARPGASVQKYLPELRRAEQELGLRTHFDLDAAIQRTALWNQRTSS